jgi:glycosyltransferase involved in cell wall biosynthesis
VQPGQDPSETVDVTVVVPVQTADGRVREVVEGLGAELESLGRSWEAVVVFDGCRGPAWEEAEALAAERPGQVRAIGFQQPFGASACLSEGFAASRGAVILTTPPYLQVEPADVSRLLEAVDAGADLVSPWRHPRVDPLLNRVQSALFNLVMRRILKARFHDLNCYFRAITRRVLEEIPVYGDMYRFLPAIAQRQGFRVDEVQVRHRQEWGGTGFFGLGVYVRRLIDILGVVFLAHFTLKPLRFFGTLGAIFAGLGASVTLVVFLQWLFLEDSSLYSRPIFLIGILLFVLGVQVIGFGLVGEIIIYTQASRLREYRIERVYEKD